MGAVFFISPPINSHDNYFLRIRALRTERVGAVMWLTEEALAPHAPLDLIL